MTAWPGSLPKCALYDTRSNGYRQATRDFQSDQGPPTRRVSASSSLRWFGGTFRMTTAQMRDFWTFYNTTLRFGVGTFTMRDPDLGTDVTVMFEDSAPPAFSTIMRGKHDVNLSFLVIA